ncbi:hypothetical protein Cfor_07093, partial [Coptotermes formosanus]
GQLPLRQCLHPETCSKNLDLPNYYAYFHDLRKEFRAFYSMPEEPQSIRDMVACILCLTWRDSEPSHYTFALCAVSQSVITQPADQRVGSGY